MNKYDQYDEAIECTYSGTETLNNGDIFIVKVSVFDYAEPKVKSGDKAYTVNELSDIKTVDLFSDIEIVCSGVSGEAVAKINKLSDSDIIKDCRFSFSKQYGLSSGETITLTIENVDELAENYHIVPKEETKEFVVEDLPKYLTSIDEIPKDQLDNIIERFMAEEAAEKVDNYIFSYGDIEYYGTFLLLPKNPTDSFMEHNLLEIVICYDRFRDGEFDEKLYFPLVFENILVNINGSVTLDYESGSNATFTTDIEKHYEDLEKDYNIIKAD